MSMPAVHSVTVEVHSIDVRASGEFSMATSSASLASGFGFLNAEQHLAAVADAIAAVPALAGVTAVPPTAT
eukprot:COSAG02_NODE_12986_length_1464_cov_1.884982_1_plen_70_part_10